MEYFQEVLDRSSGELIRISQGDWITITELGELMGTGNRQTRTVLREMGLLSIEGDGRNSRHRLARWVTDRGWGRRINHRGPPFDVVGPEAREWVAERWDQAAAKVTSLSPTAEVAKSYLAEFMARRRKRDMAPQEQVCWLCDFYPGLSQEEKSRIIGISQPLVCRFEEVRSRHLARRFNDRERMALSMVHTNGTP